MKKNAMLKIAAILMVAVLLTTCAVSSTFAKYVTTGSDDASARVAKWDVNVTVTADTAFGTAYTDNDVVSANGTAVVAPGTKNDSAITINIEGEPEVAATVGITESPITLNGWTIGNKDYCPLIISVKVGNADAEKFYVGLETDDATIETIDNSGELAAAVNAAISDAVSGTYAVGNPLDKTIVIGWEWMFEKGSTNNPVVALQNDDDDTALGDAYNATIAFDATVTISQVGNDGNIPTNYPNP